MQAKYLLIIVIVILSIYGQYGLYRKGGSVSGYLRNLAGFGQATEGRIKSYDYLRALAVVFVIAAHTVQSVPVPTKSPFAVGIFGSLSALFFNCNVLFIMLSGALILNQKEEPVSAFYRKRVFRIVIPMAVYYFFYLYLGLYHSGLVKPANLWDALKRFLSGPSDWNPHFWLMYVIIGFYLAAPFFKVMVHHLSDRLLLSFVALTLLLNGAAAWLPLLGITFGFPTILWGWESVFILGYFWTRPISASLRKPFLILGGTSFVLTAVICCLKPDAADILFNKAPTMLLSAGAIFAWFTGREKHLKKPGPVIRMIGANGFSILLIHWYILYYVVEGRLGFSPLHPGPVLGTVLTVAAVLLISLIAAFVIDKTVVLSAELVLDKLLTVVGTLIGFVKKRGTAHESTPYDSTNR